MISNPFEKFTKVNLLIINKGDFPPFADYGYGYQFVIRKVYP